MKEGGGAGKTGGGREGGREGRKEEEGRWKEGRGEGGEREEEHPCRGAGPFPSPRPHSSQT